MGFASYFERIAEIRADLIQLNETLTKVPSTSLSNANARTTALSNSCRKLINHMDELLEMATHPDVGLAERLFLADCKIDELFQKLELSNGTVDAANRRTTEAIRAKDIEIEDWIAKLAKFRVEADKRKKENIELKNELSLLRSMSNNPSDAYGVGVKPLKKR